MKYFDIVKEVTLPKYKSFFSKCALDFSTNFFVTPKLKYFFLADRNYALLRYNTQPLIAIVFILMIAKYF